MKRKGYIQQLTMRGRKGSSLWKMTGRFPACEASEPLLSLPTAPVRLSPFSWTETALRFQQRCLTVPALITVKQSHITGDNGEMPRGTPGRGQEHPADLTKVSKEVSEDCLLDTLLCPAVRGMHNCPYHFHVATDNQGFIRHICVYSHSTMTDNRFWTWSSLP